MGGEWTQACNNCCSNTGPSGELNFPEDQDGQDPKLNNQNKNLKKSRQNSVGRSGEFRQSRPGIATQPINRKNVMIDIDLNSFTMDDILRIIKIQSMVRAYLQRQKYKIQTGNMVMSNGLYFKREELLETANQKEKYDKSRPLEKVYHNYKCSGAIYEGEMRCGFREGQGKMTWKDGAIYEGQWLEGFANGKGIFYHVDGDKYDGNWKYNKCNGYGVYTNKKGALYSGHWSNDTQEGHGEEVWPTGSKYVGSYSNGMKHGHGTYHWPDGSMYIGDWLQNQINGIGHYKWKNGKVYYGTWQNNLMNGIGIYINEIEYEGEYQDDKRTGYGKYYWTDGRIYKGYWYKGSMHGLGIYTSSSKNKEKYGLWENGKRVCWFDQNTIDQINNANYSYQNEFKDQKSKNYLQKNASFIRPPNFDGDIAHIKELFKLKSK